MSGVSKATRAAYLMIIITDLSADAERRCTSSRIPIDGMGRTAPVPSLLLTVLPVGVLPGVSMASRVSKRHS